jgi:GT2 family glycosyltransferase
MKTPTLCVVVCVHNAAEYVEICIDSVLQHTHGEYELILVNDGSKTEATAVVQHFTRRHPHVRMIHHSTAKGYTKAANAGLHASTADYTILLNSDTIVSPDWAKRIIACGESDPKIGIIGPLSNAATYQSVPHVFDENGEWKHNILPGEITVSNYAESIAKIAVRNYPRVPVANGFCFAIKRDVINTIGYLDEETFPQGYGEENDYCLRASDAGFDIAIADDAYVYHAVSRSFGVKARDKLTRTAHHAIRSKYSTQRLDGIDYALRNHAEMDALRERVVTLIERAPNASLYAPKHKLFPKANQDLHFQFLLPDCTPSAGGTQMVIELARGLSNLGAPVSVAVKSYMRQEFESFYPADNHLLHYYRNDEELYASSAHASVSIATIYHSVRQLKQIVARNHHILPLYFVQDYEPLFHDEHPHLKELALQSYTMVPEARLVAISPWVQSTILEQQGIEVEYFRGSMDHDLFYPDFGRKRDGKLTVSAMIRPHTPWRAPERTLQVLKQLKEQFGSQINIGIFGCRDEDLLRASFDSDFEMTNYGVLNRHDVAGLLRATDIFLDLSNFQAFGRTALEAMACGCAVVAPQAGGVIDFGKHAENLLLIDTSNEMQCLAAASELVSNSGLRQHLHEGAIRTALDYSIHRSALDFLHLVHRLKEHKAQSARDAA